MTVRVPSRRASRERLLRVHTDEALDQVLVRHDPRTIALRAAVAATVGIGTPAWVEATVPALVVPALLVTAGATLWLLPVVNAQLVLDDVGVTLSASRRRSDRVPWPEVAGLDIDDARVRLTTSSGSVRHGPPLDAETLAAALGAASRIGVLPDRLRRG